METESISRQRLLVAGKIRLHNNPTIAIVLSLMFFSLTGCNQFKTTLKGLTGINLLSLEETLEVSKERPAVFREDIYYRTEKIGTVRKYGRMNLDLSDTSNIAVEKRKSYYQMISKSSYTVPHGIKCGDMGGPTREDMANGDFGYYLWEAYDNSGVHRFTLIEHMVATKCFKDKQGNQFAEEFDHHYFTLNPETKSIDRLKIDGSEHILKNFETFFGLQLLESGLANRMSTN